MTARILACITALLAGAWTSQAQIVEELDNGLTVIVKENHTAPVAAFRIYVRAGSMYEQEWMGMGLTHVLEHLLSGGTTTTRTEDESTAIIDLMGGANNAYTTKDHTCYYIETSADKIYTAVDVMSDWIINATIPENEYKREMGVVMEELRKGKEETSRIISQAFYETMFTTHPVRVPVIGYEELLTKITRQDVWDYYQRMYVPNNIVVVAVGDFDGPKVRDAIADAFKDAPRRAVPPITLPSDPDQLGARERTVYRDKLGGASVRIGYHSVTLSHPDLYALDVLSYILSNGRSSRLVKSLREDQNLVTSIWSSSYTPYYDAGMFAIGFDADDAKVEDAIAALQVELDRVKTDLVTADELEKAKRQKLASQVFSLQTAEAEASDLASNFMSAGNVNFNDMYLAGIRAVTAEQVRDVARKYLFDANKTTVKLRPKPQDAAATQAVDDGSVDHPIRMVTLPNGLRLLVKKNSNIPIVTVQTSFLGGVRYEPTGKAGLAGLTATALTRGAGDLSAQQIAETFDAMGGSIGGSSGNNTISLSMSTMTEDFPGALQIYAQVMLDPSFPEDQLASLKSRTLSAINRRRDNWDSAISLSFREAFFGDHPYAYDQLGTAESVGSITAADLRAHYEATFVPERGVMAIFGDIDPDTVIAQVTALFGQFERPGSQPPQLEAPAPLAENEIHVEHVDQQIAAVYIGFRGVDLESDDIPALTVLDGVMSGIGYPGGWLHTALRGGDKDLVYLVHAFNWIGIEPGFFGILAASSPPKMDDVIEIILANIEKAKAGTFTEDEITTSKAMCITMESLSGQTNSDIALQATLDELYGRGFDYSKGYADRINAVTKEDLTRVANKYFTNYVLVRQGPAPAPAPTPTDAPAEPADAQ